jgi:hypothetical protein
MDGIWAGKTDCDLHVNGIAGKGANMKERPSGKLVDGAQCKVIGGVHAGKFGSVTDIKTGKTGHISITVVQSDGVRFKTLAKNVVLMKH